MADSEEGEQLGEPTPAGGEQTEDGSVRRRTRTAATEPKEGEAEEEEEEKKEEEEATAVGGGGMKPAGKGGRVAAEPKGRLSAAEYSRKVQEWLWQSHCSYLNWQVLLMSPIPHYYSSYYCPATQQQAPGTHFPADPAQLYGGAGLGSQFPLYPPHPAYPGTPAAAAPGPQNPPQQVSAPVSRPPSATGAQQQQNGNVPQAGREYTIPSLLQRFFAEVVDFFILFFIKAAIVLGIIHISGIKDISKFAMHYIIEEIDENTSMEDLQKMMIVALIYRVLVCFYEIFCIWGAGGATPGKFLLGLRVVTCDTSVLIGPNRLLVIPATNVNVSASTVRALIKNFSIAFFFPAFITLLFFQHNRTAYDIVAGTIVVKRNGAR
ncbi:protein FAM8A1 [Latimeria chalumnae]|nr:PREDICTED: protein FAM8A1 [Latimeria chalumnae]|eukprot:XP_006006832.2 PREDICTED: protein FAM8A1 [Latimeria chalumnae]